MTTSGRPAPRRWLSRLIGAVLIGWIVAYNVMRLAGSTPADAAWPSLAIGAAAALALVGLGTLAMGLPGMSRLADPRGTAEIPAPAGRSDAQRRAIGLAWPALGVLAGIAVVVGAYLLIDALRQGEGRPSATVLILTAWNVLAGLWLGDESIRSRRGEVDGLDSAVLGCLLTAVLAGRRHRPRSRGAGAGGPDRGRRGGGSPHELRRVAPARLHGRARGRGARGDRGRALHRAATDALARCRPSRSPARSAGPWSRTAPSRCRARAPACGARFAGGGESPARRRVALAAAAWGAGALPAEALARRLFEVDPAPAPAPAAAITSDRRDGFYRWWVFVRTGDGDPAAVLRGALEM